MLFGKIKRTSRIDEIQKRVPLLELEIHKISRTLWDISKVTPFDCTEWCRVAYKGMHQRQDTGGTIGYNIRHEV